MGCTFSSHHSQQPDARRHKRAPDPTVAAATTSTPAGTQSQPTASTAVEVGRKDTWVSTFSWPKSEEPMEETVEENIVLDEQGYGPTGSPEGSRSNTIRAGEGETETGAHEPVDNENPDCSSPHTPSMTPPPVTVPCQYRTGRTLGSGTYAIVKEAVHVKTGKYYACKVINKKLMEGREYMVRNEIAVLKKISSGHRNIVTLHDYFETTHNLYLCFDICTGGELFDRICAKGNYYEADAAELVRTIFAAVQYIHEVGIVHRDLKPENLLFRTPAEDADIMIADFGLSRVMDTDKLNKLTEICGTPGYMAPEIFKKTGHGKPVDVWAMGVITYFLLAGYTPFDRNTQQEEMEAIIAGDYQFKPEEYWANVSDTARDFVSTCLTVDPTLRPTASEALKHKWLSDAKPHFVPDPDSATGAPTDLLPHIQSNFNARKTLRKAVFSLMAVKRMSLLSHAHRKEAENLTAKVNKYKEESEKENLDDTTVHYHHGDPVSPSSPPLSPPSDANDLHAKMDKASLGEASK